MDLHRRRGATHEPDPPDTGDEPPHTCGMNSGLEIGVDDEAAAGASTSRARWLMGKCCHDDQAPVRTPPSSGPHRNYASHWIADDTALHYLSAMGV